MTRRDAFWIVGGRLVDWGACGQGFGEPWERTQAAMLHGGRAGELGAHVPPDEVDEMRLVATYLASHPETPTLVLDPPPSKEGLRAFVSGEEHCPASGERQIDDFPGGT
jgi:hypothetical protein